MNELETVLAALLPSTLEQPANDRIRYMATQLTRYNPTDVGPLPYTTGSLRVPASELCSLEVALSAACTFAVTQPNPLQAAATSLLALIKQDPPDCAFCTLDALLESVDNGSIAPISGKWLVAHAADGNIMHRRQDLPPEAFVSPLSLRHIVSVLGDDYGLAFVALSYR